MKKTFPVNINGKIYYIDEDAYRLLQDYLSQLRATFPGQEGKEIVADIESRISELFDERMASGVNVIVIEDVNMVIETMGRPEELSDEADFNSPDQEPTNCYNENRQNHATICPPPPPVHKKLYRDIRHKVFGGVVAGLAQYLGWDATMMRILLVIIAFFPTPFISVSAWGCVVIYLIAWMVIPAATTPRQILEMQGQPVNIDTVGQTVINNSVPPVAPVPGENPGGFSSFLNTLLSIVAKCIVALFGFCAGCTALTVGFLTIVLLAQLGIFHFEGSIGLLDAFNINPEIPYMRAWALVCVFMSIFIPALAICRAAIGYLFNLKGISTPILITAVVLEVIFIAAATIFYNLDSTDASNYAMSIATTVLPSTILPPVIS